MTKMIDPVCDMIVEIEDARDQGLSLERPEREYAFCAQGCLLRFVKAPEGYIAKVDTWLAAEASGEHAHAHAHASDTPAIDAGMREWYKSCRCCLSDAYPEVVKVLDAEKVTATGR